MSGLLNKAIASGNVQEIAEVPASAARSLIDIIVVNPLSADATVTIWISNQINGIPTTVDLVEYAAVIPANGGKLALECINCSAGEKIFVQGTSGLVVRVTNIDESA